jgi:putative ABC transport system permease protein
MFAGFTRALALAESRRFCGQLFTRRRYNDLSELIRDHLEEKIADLTDLGIARKEAEQTARREFVNATLIEERSRDVRHWPTLKSILADLRFAFRQFPKAPAFALTAIIVVAVGIAATVSIFTFINAALPKPVPHQNPSRLVAVFESTSSCAENVADVRSFDCPQKRSK